MSGLGPISLAVGLGECVGITGPSGAGKTRFLRLIADLDPHSGNVILDGSSQNQISGPEWRRQVGLLPPDSQWWHDLVGEHFPQAYAPPLARLGLAEDCLNWAVGRLSSGEKQRLALLRLLANRPRVLLLDEPTANLDPTNVSRVEALLAEYRENGHTACLWVSHDPEQLERVSDRQLMMDNGRLLEVPRS